MSTIVLEAEVRADKGKGASRRLRRLENKVPGILYGGDKEPQPIHLLHNKVLKALETESIYSSVFDMKVNGKVEHVILKDLIKMVPLHFINEEVAPGVKDDGGMVNHTMSQVEIRCEARYLPEFIEVDLSTMAINDVLHLSNLKLPKGVHLAIDPTAGGHDHPVVSIHVNRAALVEEEVADAEDELLEAAENQDEESDEAEETSNDE